MLSQLSYSPIGSAGRRGLRVQTGEPSYRRLFANLASQSFLLVGLGRFELPTSRLSGVRSNQLSYRPSNAVISIARSFQPLFAAALRFHRTKAIPWKLNRIGQEGRRYCDFHRPRELPSRPRFDPRRRMLLRKEVIQPQVLLQLPCYDFTPITDHTLGGCPPCGLAHRLLVQPTFVM
jgi:hypothetical protein